MSDLRGDGLFSPNIPLPFFPLGSLAACTATNHQPHLFLLRPCNHRSIRIKLTLLRFTGQIKLHSILLRTSNSDSAPKTLKVIQNRDDVDFGVAEDTEGTQTFELSQTSDIQELPVKRARFGQVRRLALFFPDNFGDGDEEVTRISYLGFRGEWMQLGRAPANILYEAAANPETTRSKGHRSTRWDRGLAAGDRVRSALYATGCARSLRV